METLGGRTSLKVVGLGMPLRVLRPSSVLDHLPKVPILFSLNDF